MNDGDAGSGIRSQITMCFKRFLNMFKAILVDVLNDHEYTCVLNSFVKCFKPLLNTF